MLCGLMKARRFCNLSHQCLVPVRVSTLSFARPKSSNKLLCISQCLTNLSIGSTTSHGRFFQLLLILSLLLDMLRTPRFLAPEEILVLIIVLDPCDCLPACPIGFPVAAPTTGLKELLLNDYDHLHASHEISKKLGPAWTSRLALLESSYC